MPSKSLTIVRHCVASGPTGLSLLQQSLIDSDKPVRIYAAPTGAGKSYAFQRLIQTDSRKWVLFVVPTRRLAQNIARALLEALAAQGVDKPENVVAIWSSDEKERLKQERPSLNVGRLRLDQVNAFRGAEQCQFIISTPETVALMLVKGRFPAKGETPFQIVSFLKNFDHVVFDEFHLIEARGFGLAAAIALMSAKSGGGGAKVTLLSATPIDIKRTLTTLGVDENSIDEREETIISGDLADTGAARALHGDARACSKTPKLCPTPSQSISTRLGAPPAPDAKSSLSSIPTWSFKRTRTAWPSYWSQYRFTHPIEWSSIPSTTA
jgi:CRISPR-associated endonuclease/helicase Cas3